ncbi:MAG: NUDIX hydrolase [bacterium]
MSAEIARLRGHLADRNTCVIAPDDRGHASVAAVLRSRDSNLDLLFVLRARNDGDPWSGDIGFPGGRVESHDASARAAAERETREEIGIDLARADYVGRLDDVRGTSRSILVSAFVYHLGADGNSGFTLNPEIAEAFWIPATVLLDPSRHTSRRYARAGSEISLPAIRLVEPHHPLLWGLTYRFVEQLYRMLGYALPAPHVLGAPPAPRAVSQP